MSKTVGLMNLRLKGNVSAGDKILGVLYSPGD